MDTGYRSISSYNLERRDHTPSVVRLSRDLLFPFQLRFDSPYRGQAELRLQFGGPWSLFGCLLAVASFFLLTRKNMQSSANIGELALVLVTGLFRLGRSLFYHQRLELIEKVRREDRERWFVAPKLMVFRENNFLENQLLTKSIREWDGQK